MSSIQEAMEQAVIYCVEHVRRGGLPFVGAVADTNGKILSGYGVNLVQSTGDASAHAEIVAMRQLISTTGSSDLTGTVLLATGEPCGMCYRFAIDRGITTIYVAVDRSEVARWGINYLNSYPPYGITDKVRAALMHPLPVSNGTEPFAQYTHRAFAPQPPTQEN